jgi:hypothetical protein
MSYDLMYLCGYVPKSSMADPVTGGIQCEGEVTYGISVDFVIEVEEDTKARLCKDEVCRFGENVIVGESFFSRRESLRCQVLLDGEMWKLYNLMASPIDDGDETGTRRYHCLFCIFWTPRFVKRRGGYIVEPNSEDLREFFDTKRANRHRKTSKKSLSKFSFLLIDPK